MSSDPSELAELTARVRELESQVAALRDAAASEGGPECPDQSTPALDATKFWALQGLKARVDRPGAVLFTGLVEASGEEPVEWQQGATTESLLEADWSLGVEALAALGHATRLILLQEVLRGTHGVAELGDLEGVGTSGQLYHHLRQLVSAGWLRMAGRGRYEVPATRTVPLLVVMAAVQR